MRRVNYILLLAMLVAVVGPLHSSPVAAAPMQQAGALTNSSFEDPYNNGAAQGWSRWHEDTGAASKPAECAGRYAFQPKWERETNPQIVTNGSISQHIGNQFDTWRAGVMQTVPATPGTTYRFSFYATGRATNDQWPAPSDGTVNMGVRAGIDPNGSGLWNDADIVWGAAGSPHMGGGAGNWQQFTVEATATGNSITVFTSADFTGANQCRAHLDVWFDQAELTTAAPPPPPTSPPPVVQPPPPQVQPTATPEPTTPPEPTATSEPTATPTETPIPGATICVNAFADNNANGQRDADEGAMAGVTFRIANANNELVGQGVSSGPDPVCQEGLPPGSYQVAQEVPPALEMTTAANVTVEAQEGQAILIEFGSRIRPEATEVAVVNPGDSTPAPGSGADPGDIEADTGGGLFSGENSFLAIAGVGALLLAVILLGGLILFVLRSRA